MKFVIDAQLPRAACKWLKSAGHDSCHTLDMPKGNRTPDSELIDFAEVEDWVIVTKDADFVSSHIATGKPSKLLLISTGNIDNSKLETLLTEQIDAIGQAFQGSSFVELNATTLVIHL